MSECWVYKAYSTRSYRSEGKLLYVGISDSPSSRMGNHESQKWWWWLVDSITWQKCWDRGEAKAIESDLIAAAHPLFNQSESVLTPWDRMDGILHLLWHHELNLHMHPCCPFCESHGRQEILGPNGLPKIFRRNSDGMLVIHFETDCGMHGRVVEWACHVDALWFVSKFGQMQKQDVQKLWFECCDEAPWDSPETRMPTLAEMVEKGLQIRSHDLRLEAIRN